MTNHKNLESGKDRVAVPVALANHFGLCVGTIPNALRVSPLGVPIFRVLCVGAEKEMIGIDAPSVRNATRRTVYITGMADAQIGGHLADKKSVRNAMRSPFSLVDVDD